VAIEDHLEQPNGKPDLFELEKNGYWSVPCGMCEKRYLDDNGVFCRKCRHYAV